MFHFSCKVVEGAIKPSAIQKGKGKGKSRDKEETKKPVKVDGAIGTDFEEGIKNAFSNASSGSTTQKATEEDNANTKGGKNCLSKNKKNKRAKHTRFQPERARYGG